LQFIVYIIIRANWAIWAKLDIAQFFIDRALFYGASKNWAQIPGKVHPYICRGRLPKKTCGDSSTSSTHGLSNPEEKKSI